MSIKVQFEDGVNFSIVQSFFCYHESKYNISIWARKYSTGEAYVQFVLNEKPVPISPNNKKASA